MDRATTAETREMLRVVLGTPTPDEALPEDVVDAVILYLMETLFVKGPDDLKKLGLDGFEAAVASCGLFEDENVPEALKATARGWYAGFVKTSQTRYFVRAGP